MSLPCLPIETTWAYFHIDITRIIMPPCSRYPWIIICCSIASHRIALPESPAVVLGSGTWKWYLEVVLRGSTVLWRFHSAPYCRKNWYPTIPAPVCPGGYPNISSSSCCQSSVTITSATFCNCGKYIIHHESIHVLAIQYLHLGRGEKAQPRLDVISLQKSKCPPIGCF